jgi:hypothetical protein
MVTPSSLLDALVAALRANPDVLPLLGGNAANVKAFKHRYPEAVNLESAIVALKQPSILISHQRTIFGRQTEHQFALVLRPDGSPDDLLHALREGRPAGYGGVKFKHCQVVEECGVPIFNQYSPRVLVIGENAFLEVHEIFISLFERGADT